MVKIRALLLLIFFFAAPWAHAFAVVEANCLQGGCFKNGWTLYDLRTGQTSIVQCLEGDCTRVGWSMEMVGQGPGYNSICEPEGCFVSGWRTYDVITRRPVGSVTCMIAENSERNCLTEGWVDRPQFGGQAVLRCIQKDCAQAGWEIWLPNGQWQRAICRPGGCFERGWIVEQR
ncbi:MAG: hypothetical protein AB7N80_08575 [Bdellovibrionales bacterium]